MLFTSVLDYTTKINKAFFVARPWELVFNIRRLTIGRILTILVQSQLSIKIRIFK
jgi:hypothetical protein